MPVIVPKGLPAIEVLRSENIFVMDDNRAVTQDIRPLKIGLINLMPKKIETEIQFLRLLSNSPLQLDIDLIRISDHVSLNTSNDYLEKFYKKFQDVKNNKYDGVIITGAPVEHLEFKDVSYWPELEEIMEFAKNNVYSTMFICWAVQAGLHYYYNIDKRDADKKIFGVYEYKVLEDSPLVKGFDDMFLMPESRHTFIKQEDIAQTNLRVVSAREDSGINIVTSPDARQIYISGHGEYDEDTLHQEYVRDVNKGLDINIPTNYYEDDDPNKDIVVRWRSHMNLLFSNWLNYCVYQKTPYDLEELESYQI